MIVPVGSSGGVQVSLPYHLGDRVTVGKGSHVRQGKVVGYSWHLGKHMVMVRVDTGECEHHKVKDLKRIKKGDE